MTLAEAIKIHKGAYDLDRLMSRGTRQFMRSLLIVVVIVGGVGGTAGITLQFPYADVCVGVAFIASAILATFWLLEAYYNSYYFYGLNSRIGLDERKVTGCTYEVAETLLRDQNDIATAFATSPFGAEILMRAGLKPVVIDAYVKESRAPITTASVAIEDNLIIRLDRLALVLLQRDPSFADLLARNGIFEEQFMGAARWVAERIKTYKRRARWWSKDNLSKARSLGSEWSYGQTYHLQQYAKDLKSSAVFSTLTANTSYAKEKIEEIEGVIARDLSANVLLVGEPGVGKADILMEVARRIQNGEALYSIVDLHMVVLDTARLFAVNETKQEIEEAIMMLFSEAEAAGNIILVIENISTFINESASIDIHIPELIDRFLASDSLHVVVTETPTAYHTYLEPLRAFTRRFQEVLIDSPSSESTVRLLASIADQYERAEDALFTYQALTALAVSAERYIVNGVMPDKAVQLMADVYADSVAKRVTLITADHVYKVVTEKTGIPAGPVKESEKETLLNLEDILHRKVIGQNNAVSAIARTMRRARAGIQASDRPIGSFLFLGPTGVGKTETAKALASVFFESESAMNRVDMSEYSDAGALDRLLGDADRPGVLANLLQERPYCVLLLDEFEKADSNVHDLFLQVLDEGVFTDGRGTKVNARNAIIIATSNAGSDLIMKTLQSRQSVSVLNAEIINHIINRGILKPELVNRFDSTIIFEPLMEHEQASVAQLLLNDLTGRIREQGYLLKLSDRLLQAIVEKGYSPEFGARPMRRLLQDLIEEKVAEKIIAGLVPKGEVIALDIPDFTPEELAVQAT